MPHPMLQPLGLPAFPTSDAENWPNGRAHILHTLLTQEYGMIPADLPCAVNAQLLRQDDRFAAGKSPLKLWQLTLTLPQGSCSFPVKLCMPAAPGPHPLFICLNFHSETPSPYLPSEEIADRGYGVLSVNYQDISPDRQDHFADGLAKLLRQAAAEAAIPPAQWPGKIAVWAWAACRMLDWALTQPQVDSRRVAVIGHSRLGKTALVAGMLDERFACVISNDSGCSGAAVTRGKPGEHIADITRNFPFWFCEQYQAYTNNEQALPFEQDWLLAAIAPRLLLVGSAIEDEWAGPSHEYLGCVSASRAWEGLNQPGFVHPDRLPQVGDVLHEGAIGYHLRAGKHYLSREDWNRYMDFLDRKGW